MLVLDSYHRLLKQEAMVKPQNMANRLPSQKGGEAVDSPWFYLECLTTATASVELTALSRFTSARRNFRTETFSKSVYLPL